MAKTSKKRPASKARKGTAKPATKTPAGDAVVHTSLYLSASAFDALREIAFRERCKIHDVCLDGIDAVLVKNGYPPTERRKRGPKSAP